MAELLFPSEFPKNELFAVVKIVASGDVSRFTSLECSQPTIWCVGCFDAMRYDGSPQPVGSWWLPLLPIAQQLLIKLITEYFKQPAPAFAADADVTDYSSYTVEQLADELQAKLAA